MIKSVVYYGNTSIGEVEVWPMRETNLAGAPAWVREIRVDRLSQPSERCPPLAVLHAVAAGARCLVMESRPTATADEPPPPLVAMHTACLRDNKEQCFKFQKWSKQMFRFLNVKHWLLRHTRDGEGFAFLQQFWTLDLTLLAVSSSSLQLNVYSEPLNSMY